jgi:hypothetical protein
MHRTQVRQMIRDMGIASAIFPVVNRHHLTRMAVEGLLSDLHVAKPGNVARMAACYGAPVP